MKPFYEHAGITIYHGDCREVMPTLEPVDLVLTDPPYGVHRETSYHNASRGHLAPARHYGIYNWPETPVDDDLIRLTVGAANRAVIWGGNYFTRVLAPGPGWFVWDKLNSGDFADCELAWTNLPQAVRIFRHMWNGMLRASERDTPRVHPTQKPVALMKWCLGFAPDAQTILDPFIGSGATLKAAKDLGRRAIGIEIEEKYCEIAAKRLSQEVLDFSIQDTVL